MKISTRRKKRGAQRKVEGRKKLVTKTDSGMKEASILTKELLA
jgi:hypothetical protein